MVTHLNGNQGRNSIHDWNNLMKNEMYQTGINLGQMMGRLKQPLSSDTMESLECYH